MWCGRCLWFLVLCVNECDESNIQHEMTKTNANFGDDLPESFVWMDAFQYFSFVMAIGNSLSAHLRYVSVVDAYTYYTLRRLISFLCSLSLFLFIYYIYLFLLFAHIKCCMVARKEKKIHAFDKFQHIFTLTLNIWLMPIWNGKPHSAKRCQIQGIDRKREFSRISHSIFGPIWFGVKRGQKKRRQQRIAHFLLLVDTTIFIPNKFWPQSIPMQLKKREKQAKEKKSVIRN